MNWLYKTCKTGAYLYYKLFFKLEVEGIENIDLSQHYVICANHLNLQDPFVLGGLLPLEARFMAKKELFKFKIVAAFLRKIGVFPVDRDANDLKAIKTALGILKADQNLGLFPEGTRNKGYTPLPVKAGTAMFAIRTKTPVLAITIDSYYKFRKPLRVVFHKPVEYSEYYDQKLEPEQYETISQEIMNRIYSQLKYYKQK
jgi:1-acyl-sn-glycerol-3-phosphate acyltransferase